MPFIVVTSQPDHPSPENGTRVLALLIAAGFVSVWIYKGVIPETGQVKFDFAPYYAAWYAVHTGHAFYEAETGESGLHGDVFSDLKQEMGIEEEFSAYIYPPQFAWLGSSLANIPYATCRILWVWTSAALWLACVVVLLGRSLWDRPLLASFLVSASLLFPPMAYSLSLGQINIVLFALIVASWRLIRGDRHASAGALIAVAALIKPMAAFANPTLT